MPEARAVWRSRWYDRTGAALYDFAVERESLARVLGLPAFGTDARVLYGSMSGVAEMPDGEAILDAPCGGGLAFRALGRHQRVRYVAADLSRGMLRRARRVAERRGLDQIEFVEADIESLPFEDASFDLCLCFNSLLRRTVRSPIPRRPACGPSRRPPRRGSRGASSWCPGAGCRRAASRGRRRQCR